MCLFQTRAKPNVKILKSSEKGNHLFLHSSIQAHDYCTRVTNCRPGIACSQLGSAGTCSEHDSVWGKGIGCRGQLPAAAAADDASPQVAPCRAEDCTPFCLSVRGARQIRSTQLHTIPFFRSPRNSSVTEDIGALHKPSPHLRNHHP